MTGIFKTGSKQGTAYQMVNHDCDVRSGLPVRESATETNQG